jgi:NAD(P)-dependent dehydrogenase (short-subunit alcohol dehydrogenase family)
MDTATDTEIVPDYLSRMGLGGRVAVVAGAGRGIGRQTVHALAQAGARLACVDVDPAAALSVAAEVGGRAFQADVRDAAQVEALFDSVEAALGFPGIVVDIVGASERRKLSALDADFLARTFELNLFQAVHVTRIAAGRMARGGGGSIVLIGSSAGLTSLPDQIGYGAAKAALHHFVRGAAAEVGHLGVRVNAIAPGYVRTQRMLDRFGPDQWAEVEAGTPLQRAGATPDIAGIALFLAQDLSAYVTGQVILADGGMLCPPRVMRATSARQIAGIIPNEPEAGS